MLAGPGVTGSLSPRNRASKLEFRCLKAPAGPASHLWLLICLCTRQGAEGPLASFGPVTVSRFPPHLPTAGLSQTSFLFSAFQ